MYFMLFYSYLFGGSFIVLVRCFSKGQRQRSRWRRQRGLRLVTTGIRYCIQQCQPIRWRRRRKMLYHTLQPFLTIFLSFWKKVYLVHHFSKIFEKYKKKYVEILESKKSQNLLEFFGKFRRFLEFFNIRFLEILKHNYEKLFFFELCRLHNLIVIFGITYVQLTRKKKGHLTWVQWIPTDRVCLQALHHHSLPLEIKLPKNFPKMNKNRKASHFFLLWTLLILKRI